MEQQQQAKRSLLHGIIHLRPMLLRLRFDPDRQTDRGDAELYKFQRTGEWPVLHAAQLPDKPVWKSMTTGCRKGTQDRGLLTLAACSVCMWYTCLLTWSCLERQLHSTATSYYLLPALRPLRSPGSFTLTGAYAAGQSQALMSDAGQRRKRQGPVPV
ncbi:hypothetical protein SRHO_G00003170 [Serrasalmus rhombeus]